MFRLRILAVTVQFSADQPLRANNLSARIFEWNLSEMGIVKSFDILKPHVGCSKVVEFQERETPVARCDRAGFSYTYLYTYMFWLLALACSSVS